jgi:hypothetical protein
VNAFWILLINVVRALLPIVTSSYNKTIGVLRAGLQQVTGIAPGKHLVLVLGKVLVKELPKIDKEKR